jgi:multidrug efflux pump subunit AcrA (membrane-fusion protein)
MSANTAQPLTRRTELLMQPLGGGRYVVKDRRSGEFFQIGEEEYFLLEQLDGEYDAAEICAAFEQRFGEPLSTEDLDGFLAMAREKGFLEGEESFPKQDATDPRDPVAGDGRPSRTSRQSLLYWRKSLFDPDRLFDWLEPKIRFFWTRAFLVLSALSILCAVFVAWSNGSALVSQFPDAMRWETLVAVWFSLALVTTLHEFAHGLTCKHYGGEVREIGFLMLLCMPAFYCNVSDAWLFPEKRKRVWVTFAGAYFELFLWSLAIFVWRLTMQDTLVNYLAWVVMSLAGVRTLLNFNPMIRLDGYYLLSDLTEVPNLRQRGWERFQAQLRRWLWGAETSSPGSRGRLLFWYGAASWLFSIGILTLMLTQAGQWMGDTFGWGGVLMVLAVGGVFMSGLFRGFSQGEVSQMLFHRWKRTTVWCVSLGAIGAFLFLVPFDFHVDGDFVIRPVEKTKVSAPVSGFLKSIEVSEGERVSPGQLVARLDDPDLESLISQKQAEIEEAEAELELLQIGPRPEEIDRQQKKVERLRSLTELDRERLAEQKQIFQSDLKRLDEKIAEYEAQVREVEQRYQRTEELRRNGVKTQSELETVENALAAAQAQLSQVRAERKARDAAGTMEAEALLARRESELADAEDRLQLLQSGSRPAEIQAARARIDRLTEELNLLQQRSQRLQIDCSIAGCVTTPDLPGKAGDYLQKGDTICEVERLSSVEVKITIPEQDIGYIEPNQPVTLKARSMPFKTTESRVCRVAPRFTEGKTQNQVDIYCRVENPDRQLHPGMTGHARIYCGDQPLGKTGFEKAIRYLRTEFWW